MARFKIKYEGLHEAIANWKVVANKISSSIEKLNAIANELQRNESLRNYGYRNSVASVGKQLEDLKTEFDNYSKTIESIEQLYRTNEDQAIRLLHVSGLDVEGIFEDLKLQKKELDFQNEVASKADNVFGISFDIEYNADPVNMSTGNYIYQKELISYDAELPLSFGVFYNAMDKRRGILGNGWVHSFESHLYVYDKGIYIRDTDGSIYDFVNDGESYVPKLDKKTKLSADKEEYVFINEEGTRYIFDRKGNWIEITAKKCDEKITAEYEDNRLKKVSHNNGTVFLFEYDRDNRLTSVIDQGNRNISFVYDGNRLGKMIDACGNEFTYEYDLEGFLCRVTNPDGVISLKNFYDEYGRVLEQSFPDGGVSTFEYNEDEKAVVLTQQNGNVITYIHDENYRSTKTIYSDGEENSEYDENGNRIAFVDKNNNRFSYEYDDKGNLIKASSPLKITEYAYTDDNQLNRLSVDGNCIFEKKYDDRGNEIGVINALGNSVRKVYDEKGRLEKYIQEDGSVLEIRYDEKGNISTYVNPVYGKVDYEYDDFRRVKSFTDALGRTSKCSYDDNNNLVSFTDPEGNSRYYHYDRNNNLIRIVDFDGSEVQAHYNYLNKIDKYIDQEGNETSFGYDQMWNISRRTDPNGAETLFEYDQLNRLSAITYPDGGVEKAEYDPNGNIIRRIAQDGGVYEFAYDALNRGVSIKDPVGETKYFEYDCFDNIKKVDYSSGAVEEYEYDKLGQCIKSTSADGYTKYYSWTPLGNIEEVSDDEGWLERYEYYPGGLIRKISEVNGNYREISYDAAGNITSVALSGGTEWKFSYDSLDRIIAAESNKGIKEQYEYDPVGNLTAIIDGLGEKTSYSYNKAGQLNSVIDPLGDQTLYQYDSCQRLIAVFKNGEDAIDPNEINSINDLSKYRLVARYTRDLSGRVIVSSDAEDNETSIRYDACGRIIEKILPEGNSIRIQYNPDGSRKSFELSDGRKAVYEYNALKQLIQLQDWLGTVSFERDGAGKITKTTNYDGSETSYKYDNRRRKTEIRYPNGDVVNHIYDSNNRLSRLIAGDNAISYRYDDDGRLIGKDYPHDYREEFSYAASDAFPDVKVYQNDDLVNEVRYRFDTKGQIISKTNLNNEMSFSYDRLGRLTSVLKNNDPSELFEYDRFGNRTRSVKDNKETFYQYNRLNQLIKRIESDGECSYAYDRNGSLIQQIDAQGEKTEFIYDSLDYLKSVKNSKGSASYQTDSLGERVSADWMFENSSISEKYIYDHTYDYSNLLVRVNDGMQHNQIKDLYMPGELGTDCYEFDEITDSAVFRNLMTQKASYDSFGAPDLNGEAQGRAFFGFGGYWRDPLTGIYHADQREYDPLNGLFTSPDPFGAVPAIPSSYNYYSYCYHDPINCYDPTGLFIVSGLLLAAVTTGVVGAAKAVIDTGKQQTREMNRYGETNVKWHDYVGNALGGFFGGVTDFVSFGTMGKSVKNSVSTFTTGTLKCLTNEKKYRKEDGFSYVKDVLGESAKAFVNSGLIGSLKSMVFGDKKSDKHKKYKKFSITDALKGGAATIGVYLGETVISFVGEEMFNDTMNIMHNKYRDVYCTITEGGSRSLDEVLESVRRVNSSEGGGQGSFGSGGSMGGFR